MSETHTLVLLVEDNVNDISLTRRVLKKRAVASELVVVRDGQEALDFLLATGPYANRPLVVSPAVVLLDLNLMKVSGLTVLETIRSNERIRLMPVVILSTSAEDRDMEAAYRLGANSYIQKPVDYEQFSDAIYQVVSYWTHINVAPDGGWERRGW